MKLFLYFYHLINYHLSVFMFRPSSTNLNKLGVNKSLGIGTQDLWHPKRESHLETVNISQSVHMNNSCAKKQKPFLALISEVLGTHHRTYERHRVCSHVCLSIHFLMVSSLLRRYQFGGRKYTRILRKSLWGLCQSPSLSFTILYLLHSGSKIKQLKDSMGSALCFAGCAVSLVRKANWIAVGC